VYKPKDFIETEHGLRFAVVAEGSETGMIRCFLRYIFQDGRWRKVATETANGYLRAYFPQYLFHSAELDADLHAVDRLAIIRHYSPTAVLQTLLQQADADPVLADLRQLCGLLQAEGIPNDNLGITGSLLIGLQNPDSDIDLLCYDRCLFHQLRRTVQNLIEQRHCQPLSDADWRESYRRRACDELSLEEYIRHERRKFNKAMINRRKFDITLVSADARVAEKRFRKLGPVRIEAVISDDSHAFDYPAEFALDHAEIACAVSFTATYSGQAQTGERVSIAGQLEQDQHGGKRIVIGSDREAAGEYIKVLW